MNRDVAGARKKAVDKQSLNKHVVICSGGHLGTTYFRTHSYI